MNVRVRTLSGSARHYLPIGVLVLITGMFLGFLCLPALEGAAESVLPVSGSVKGWVMDGRISRFNPDNLLHLYQWRSGALHTLRVFHP